jgi:hypothetical protein
MSQFLTELAHQEFSDEQNDQATDALNDRVGEILDNASEEVDSYVAAVTMFEAMAEVLGIEVAALLTHVLPIFEERINAIDEE